MAKKKRKAAKKKAAKKKGAKKKAPKKAKKAKKVKKAKKAKAKAKPKKAKKKRKPYTALMRTLTPSPELAEVVGKAPLPRAGVVQKLWAYIRKNGLQDQANRRMINADDKLKAVFKGKSQVSMFEMNKLVAAHLT